MNGPALQVELQRWRDRALELEAALHGRRCGYCGDAEAGPGTCGLPGQHVTHDLVEALLADVRAPGGRGG